MDRSSQSNGTNHKSGWSTIKPSKASMRITNPIRDIIDQLKGQNNPDKTMVDLSIGDPTVYGNLLNPENVNQTLIKNVQSRKFNGYAHSTGQENARKSVARKFSTPESPLTEKDVIISSGCSGAIDMAFGVLANEGQNILIPSPGFSFYQTCCEFKGIQCKFYKLLPEKSWEADLAQMESLIDENTAAILVNNPSNPCGSVYSKEHLMEILKIAERHKLPIIADEIYGQIVFSGNTFYPMASLSQTVPILAVGGTAKSLLVPGWRLGWVIIHDRNDLFKEVLHVNFSAQLDQVRVGLLKLSQILLGANTLAQSIIEESLLNTPHEWTQNLNDTLERNAKELSQGLQKISGLTVVEPGGAMYMMLGVNVAQFKDIKDDVEFAKKLLAEESVFVLPGRIFKFENFVRLVISPPTHLLAEAISRIKDFCDRHRV